MLSRDIFIRDIESDNYRENFLVSAVVTIFVIRIFLKLTHYFILGGGNIHIAHMLWGGFFMAAAIIVLLSFLSKAAVHTAAILGGIGFGFFIDELGKFITSDNDYFFQPTVAFIYIIFVLMYLIIKFIPHYQKISQKEYLVNAIEMIKESAVNDFDIEEEKRAKSYLRHCDPDDPMVIALKKLLSQIDATPTPKPNVFTRMRIKLRDYYYQIAQSGIIINAIIIFLAVQTVLTFFYSASFFITRPVLPFNQWGKLYSSSLAGIFVLIGLFALRFSKIEAYRFFRIAMLITILLTEFFAFMHSQWYELIGLGANIFVLLVINYAATMENQKNKLQPHEK